MADADADDAAYSLRAPARRRDTITRQLQREILGGAASLADQCHKTEEDEPPSSTSKRHTLSPTKALQLLQDTEALAAELQQEEQEQEQDVTNSPSRSARSKTSADSKWPRSETKKTLAPVRQEEEERRKSTSMVDTSDSFTDSMFAPNLLEQDAMRRPTLDPTEAAAVVATLQKEARRLSNSSALDMEETDTDEEEQDQNAAQAKQSESEDTTPSKQTNGKKASTPTKESEKSPGLVNVSKSSKSPTPSKESKSRKSSSPAKGAKSRKSPSPVKNREPRSPAQNNSKRRATVDPTDALTMLDASLQQEDDRRQTIDERGLFELVNALERPSGGGKHPPHKAKGETSRKRANDSDAREGSPEKRARPYDGNNDKQTMESMGIASPLHDEANSSSPAKAQRSPDELPPSRIPKPALFSPPPGGSRTRTPLKGILSARKGRRNAEGAVQSTPNKSVNFGPSQGAEFNHGSPSTSMTPMLAKDASRLYPYGPPVSDEEPDDAETSLNSSILDEVDSFDEEEEAPIKVDVWKDTQLKKPGFDVLQSRRSSIMASKSTNKSHRRHSMRGYSPLDSQTVARRRRRQTINVTRPTSTTTATSFSATEKPTDSSQSPSSTRRNSFLRPYADSSSSSGEDMEITGEYSVLIGRGTEATSTTDPPRDDDTAEFSLGHLLAEHSVYELTQSAPGSDQDLPESLADLANEVVSAPSGQENHAAEASHQDTTLDPIQESDENMASSRNHSTMSLVSDDSDEEYAGRDSLQVNLKSTFDRVSIGDDPIQGSQPPPSPEPLSVHLVTMKELLSSVTLDEENASVGMEVAFFGDEVEASDNQIAKDVKLACAHDTCLDVVERHAQDIFSWSTSVSEELSSLLQIKAPAVFSPENLDDAGREAIQELYATEAMVARTGWCQSQAQIEKHMVDSLSVGADALAKDVKTLKDSVAADVLKRQHELATIKDMIDREEQMALLLDAIEEQQGAHNEYVAAVKDLENECSSLSLEESVLQSRLKVLEGRAAELEPVTSAAATLFEQEVLATEEMLAIQENMSVWKICEATASLLRLKARFEDVLFDVEICVDVHLGPSSVDGSSTSIKTNESLKQREGNTYLPYEGDVVLVLQRLLLNPHYISRVADESELGDGNDGRVCSKLQVLEHFISRSFRLLKELRELSTHFSMRYRDDDSTLWVDFLKFPSVASHIDIECSQFSVGFSLLPVFPYTDYQTAVKVPHGQVSTEAVVKEIGLVSREEPKYFTRVCRRLHESFVR